MVVTLQIIVYFPIYGVDIPPNTLIFLDAVRKIAEFKVIDTKKLIRKHLLPVVVRKTKGGQLTDSFKNAGFESHDFLDNIQYFLILGTLFVLIVLILAIISLFKKYKRFGVKKLRKIRKSMIWNGIL